MPTTWISKAFAPIAVSAVIIATKVWTEASHRGIWLVIASTLLIAIADSVADSTPKAAARLFAARLFVALCVFVGTLIISLAILAVYGPGTLPSILPSLLVGCAVGVAVRSAFVISLRRQRRGRSTHLIRLYLMGAAATIVFLIPSDRDRSSASYVFGIGCGFFIQFGARRLREREARRHWETHAILKPLQTFRTEPTNPPEVLAASLLASHKIDDLQDFLQNCDSSRTPGLTIINSTFKRIRGDDLEAVKALQNGLRLQGDGSKNHALAHLLLAILLRESGDDEGMVQSLSEAKLLAGNCQLVDLLDAVRIAEGLPLPGDATWVEAESLRNQARELISHAVEFGAKTVPKLALSPVVAYNVPLTRTFIDDAYAYVLLKCGNLSASEKLLDGCLREDSGFAPGYLHYGEWHLAQATISRARHDPEREGQSRRAAEFCFWMAIGLDPHEGHTARRARKLLELAPTSSGNLNEQRAA